MQRDPAIDLREEMQILRRDLRDEMRAMKAEIIQAFRVAAEQIRHDMMTMHKDHIEWLTDKANNHERRLQSLEARPL